MIKKILLSGLIIILIFTISCVTIKVKKQVAIDYFNLGNNYLEVKDYKNAIISFEKSLEYNPKAPETVINLIISYQKNKDYDKAEKYILKYYKRLKFEYAKKLIIILGNNFFYQEKYNKAIKTYDQYIEAYPEDANCYFNLGLTYLKLLDEEKAITYFLEAYKYDNNHVPAIYDIADYYYKKENFEESLYYFSLLKDLDSKNPEVFYRLGILEYKINEYEKAKEHLLKAIDLDDENYDYYISLAKVYAKGYKNKNKTLEYLEEAFKNGFNDLKYLKSTSEFKLLYEYNKFKKLIKQYGIK